MTTTIFEIEAKDFVEIYGDVSGWCEANLAHDPKGCGIGFSDQDYDDRPGSRFVWQGAWKITNRHGDSILACEDCAGCIEYHEERLGEPDVNLETVRFDLVDPDPPQTNCDAEMQHNLGHAQGGEFSVDYGGVRPRLKRVCGLCLPLVLEDLRVMGWPTEVERLVESIQADPHQFVPWG